MIAAPEQSRDARGIAVAVSSLRGVASSRVVRRRGESQVRLRLEDGVDAEAVAEAVRERLSDPSDVIDLTTGDDSGPESGLEVAPDHHGDPQDQGARQDQGAPHDAGAHGRPLPLVVVERVSGPGPGGSASSEAPPRLALARTSVGVQGWAALAEVALADGEVLHVGAAEAAATADGSRKALAAAAAQALESAGAGALRIEVDGVQVEPVAGREAAVVALSVVSARGAEQLIGCALVGDDPARAVVNAVLSAANRRIELAMAERGGPAAG